MRSLPALSIASAVLIAALPVRAATEWIVAGGYPENNFHTQNMRMFAEEIDKESKGELKLTLHTNGTLIKEFAIKRAVQARQVQAGEIRLGVYSNEDAMYMLCNLPFVVSDYDQA